MIPHSWIEVARIMVREREQNWKVVEERREAMVQDLEAARDWDEVPRNEMGRIAAVRRQVGAAMIRAGERLLSTRVVARLVRGGQGLH